jgi:hypothetical protein
MAAAHEVTFRPHAEETELEGPTAEQQAALDAAGGDAEALRRVAARWPTLLEAWASLAETADDPVSSYAFARVGYHRGLDAMRRSGWRGAGRLRAQHRGNLGFLRSLNALRSAASGIGEDDEVERCQRFLDELDPEWRAHLDA